MPSTIPSSAAATSAAEAGRFSAFFESSRWISPSSGAGTPGFNCRTGCGALLPMAISTAIVPEPVNGWWPVQRR